MVKSVPSFPTPQLQLVRVELKAAIGGGNVGATILNQMSLEVQAGDRLAIVGPSGAGKTSLLRLLNRLIDPTQGAIYFEGRHYENIPVLELRQQVTLVLQECKLLGMSVGDAIRYPLVLRGMKAPEIKRRVVYWLEQLNVPSEWLDRTEVQLSLGERQLVGLCRALAIQPKILLLDEPTSALDAGRSASVLRRLRQLAQTEQTTIVMVNHQLDLAEEFCTRVVYLERGNLVEECRGDRADWEKLRSNLIEAEAESAREWE